MDEQVNLPGQRPPPNGWAALQARPAAWQADRPVQPGDLRMFPILRGLSDGDLDYLLAKLSLAHAFGGQIGTRTEVEEVRFSLVLSGAYRVVAISAAGASVTLRSFGPGDHFGEVGILAHRAPGNWSLVADQPGDVLYMSPPDLREALERLPMLSNALLEATAGQAADWAQRIFELAVLSPRARLLAELVRLADRRGLSGRRVVLSAAPTHDALAAQVGITREAVSRNMNHLRREGLVLSGRREIVLMDLPRMRALVNGEID